MTHRHWIGLVSAVVVLIGATDLCGPVSAISNPYVRNPVGPGTVPQSSVRGGLVGVPNPIDTSANLIMTGNVGEGKHFRGFLPYGSTTGFRSSLGSSSLDPFLRYSAGAEDIGQRVTGYRGDYRPFYSPTGTVSMAQPGGAALYAAPGPFYGAASSPRIATPLRAQSISALRSGTAAPEDGAWYSYRTGLLSRSPAETETAISDETGVELSGVRSLEQYRQRIEQIQQRLREAGVDTQRAQTQPSASSDEDVQLGETLDIDRLIAQQSSANLGRQMLRQRGDSTETQESAQRLGEIKTDKTAGDAGLKELLSVGPDTGEGKPALFATPRDTTAAGVELPALERIRRTAKPYDVTSLAQSTDESGTSTAQGKDSGSSAAAIGRSGVMFERLSRISGRDELDNIDEQYDQSKTGAVAQAGDAVKQKSTPFKSFAQEKYARYMKTGDSYMKQGRFYRAADAYTLAAVYSPDDPAAYAGKAHALFAAGEYISSAAFLVRAIEVGPEYLFVRLDLVAIAGGPAYFEQRLSDLEKCAKAGSSSGAKAGSPHESGELQFLLAYVYYRLGQFELARTAIGLARESLGDLPAVAAIQKALGVKTPAAGGKK